MNVRYPCCPSSLTNRMVYVQPGIWVTPWEINVKERWNEAKEYFEDDDSKPPRIIFIHDEGEPIGVLKREPDENGLIFLTKHKSNTLWLNWTMPENEGMIFSKEELDDRLYAFHTKKEREDIYLELNQSSDPTAKKEMS